MQGKSCSFPFSQDDAYNLQSISAPEEYNGLVLRFTSLVLNYSYKGIAITQLQLNVNPLGQGLIPYSYI